MFSTTAGGSWISAIFDEIALEGLDGVTLPWLWTLLATRLQCGPPLPEKLQQQAWMLLLRSKDRVEFFELETERPLLPPYQRSNDLDSDVGLPLVPKSCPFLRLPYAPIQDGHIMGNCADYYTRKAIDVKELQEMTAIEATKRWHQKLVVVASQEQRIMALKPPNVLLPSPMFIQQYIFLECVGRSRFNGEQTAGPWSLINYFKDSSLIFYTKNKLMMQGMITAQSYVERSSSRTVCSVLVMLPRFFHIFKSHQQRVIEKLYMELQLRPNHQIPNSEIPDHLEDLTPAQVKKLTQSHGFRKIYETTQIRMPVDGTGKDSTKMRKVTVLRLRNPLLKFEELLQSDNNESKEEKAPPEFLSQKHAYLDMPLELECLRAILRFGSRGMSTIELSQYVAINVHTARGCIKYLRREKLIDHFTENVGKTRITRYFAGSQAAADVNLKQEQLVKTAQQLQCKEEPSLPPNVDIVLNDLPEIVASIRHMTFGEKETNKSMDKETQRLVQRKLFIVRQIDQKCIMHTCELTKIIKQMDHDVGFQESICRKSLYRILQKMKSAGILNVYEVTLQYNQRLRLYRLVTHPKIDMNHEQLQREVLRLKSNFHLINEERLSRPGRVNNTKKRRELIAAKKQQQKCQPKPMAPKLLLACILHEFIFYVLGEQQRDQKPLPMSVELLQHWQSAEPALLTRQYLKEWQADESHILPYTEEISWRTFIPPLPVYENKPPGWFYFMDAVERMPLSLMMRIFRIERDFMEQLRPQLQHPVRQHYLLRHLQTQNLIPRLRQQQLFLGTLRLLNNMGLIQVSECQLGRDELQRWVYFNRRTCLLDTTTSSGHNYNRISNERNYEELKFEFNTREQVADYWAKLQHVCIYTKLGFLKHKERRIGTKNELRLPLLTFVRTVEFEEALELDNGSVPGDHLGAAGLNSLLFAHQFRHWSWVKRTASAVNKATASPATGKSSTALPVRKRLSLMRLKSMPKLHLRKARGLSALVEARKRKSGPRDDIDRDALRNMRTLRVTWTAAEDRLLKMGRAVYLFIDAPLPALALCNVGCICRDVIRQYLGICNKTTQACVRRLQFLIRKKRDQPDVPNWIYTMQTQPEINSIYNERFLAELKREYPLRSEQSEALLIHFVLILGKLHHIINSADTIRRQFILPDNMEDYQRQFRECMPLNADVDQVLYSNPSSETELQVTVALGVLHSILCCAKDKTLFNLQAFEIYKHFSEDVLNAAFNKARANSLLVAVKRRNIHPVSRQVSGPAHLLSSKYKCRLICQKLGHVLYDTYYSFEQRLSHQDTDAYLQLASPNFAQLLLLGEWVSKKRLHLILQLPANILTVDTSSMSRPCGSATDRILDHYSSIFDNAPQTEYAKRLESECSARQAARVRFHPANLTYRLQYSAYNQLSKLPLRAMHFFCALDALGQSVNISCARLELGECPFGCIMRSGNYLNAVERITYEHRPILKQLVADAFPQTPLQLQLDSSTASSTTLTVSTSNLLTLVQQLEAYWRQQQQDQECKDLGKTLAERTLHKLTDWRALCTGLLDFEAGKQDEEHTQDYEPSLNKEERARAQDVFVVHLPTIQFRLKSDQEHLQPKDDNLRKAVLEKVTKASYWRYTENTFDTLLPTLKAKDYDASAIQHMEEILQCVEQRPLGVMGTELRRIFPFGKFLLEALHELEEHDLIKRVGVASHMYVHKLHMRHWVVHTFHIKRLDRERVQTFVAVSPATPQAVLGKKRKATVDLEESEQPSTSKQAKLALMLPKSSDDSDSNDSLASFNRRCKRFELNANKPDALATPTVDTEDSTRDVIVMRPQPWIRVNASLNRRVLDRWLGAVLSECISRTGCTVHSLFLRFPHLLPVDIMLLLELLCDLDCIHLMELDPPTVHVETTYEEELKEQQVTELYDPICTYVKAHCDAIGRLTNFIGRKHYSSEFI